MYALLLAPVVVFAILALVGVPYLWPQDVVLYNVPFAVAAILAWRHAKASPDVGAWRCISVSMAVYLVANLVYSVQDTYPERFPWWTSDIFFLASLPFLYAAIIMIVRQRIGRWQPSLVLDGAIIFTGAAALLYQPLYAKLITGDENVAKMIIYGAYPVFDLVLVAMAITGAMILRHGVGKSWGLLNAAFITFAAADTWYLTKSVSGTYVDGSFSDSGWLLAGALVSMAAVTKWRNAGVHVVNARAMFFWPLLMSSAVIVTMLMYTVNGTTVAATSFMGLACLALTVARVSLSMNENRKLGSSHADSRTDEVTGLGNRRRFDEQLTARIDAGESVALCLVDLDGFKRVNDAFGHDNGDRLLRQVARQIETVMPEQVISCRIGGDEFALIMDSMDEVALKRLHHQLRQPFNLGPEINVQIDSSLGASSSDGSVKITDLIRRADRAMYSSKASGGGVTIDCSDDAEAQEQISEIEMIHALRESLKTEDGGLEVYYQPIVALDSHDRPGVEALARWKYQGQMISPEVFINIAEQNGMMQLLTRRVLQRSVRDLAKERAGGRDLMLSVNLAVSSLLDPTLIPTVKRVLSECNFPASSLKLEITENMVITDPRASQRTVNQLRDMGVDVMVDDYGTGYASIGHLQTLDVDGLKLDRSLISGIEDDPRMRAIVRATIEMGHALDIKIVAEGVETHIQHELLMEMGCDFIQGYFIARPMDAASLGTWLRENVTPGMRAA